MILARCVCMSEIGILIFLVRGMCGCAASCGWARLCEPSDVCTLEYQ